MKYNWASFHLVKILGKYFSLARNGQTTYLFCDWECVLNVNVKTDVKMGCGGV